MRTLIQYGAGNIGRGFIGPVFNAVGWHVVFVEVQDAVLTAIAERGAYTVTEVTNDGATERRVDPVSVVDGRDLTAVAQALAEADLVATAVGLGALKHIAGGLAAGLERRRLAGRPLDVLVCENGIQAPDILRAAVAEAGGAKLALWLADHCGFVRTSIGRMVPPPTHADPLDITVEPYATLPVEQAAFRSAIPNVPGLVAKPDFDLVLRQKLYLHNGTHAALAYAGILRGHATIPDCMDDDGLVAAVRAAASEVGEALARAHGDSDDHRQTIRDECSAMCSDLFERYRNRALGDPVRRVARDPLRKLAGDDRLVGAARLCCAQGVEPQALAARILDACRYPIGDDEPSVTDWRRWLANGWHNVLTHTAALELKEPLMSALENAERRQQAAKRIRSAGIHLKDDEACAIEIADFGLGRFLELGLAIHVYVNTDRCCAKELAMEPGQICPEHRHPCVDGHPGKEETFRCRAGEVHLFLPGHQQESDERSFALGFLPADKAESVSVYRHVHLLPGDQFTLPPDTLHWFVAGPEGAVVSEFSTRSMDEADIFTDSAIQRVPDPA